MKNRIQTDLKKRSFSITPESFSKKDRTLEVVFSSETPVLMNDWNIGTYYEVLSHEEGHVRLDRLKRGASVLDNHNRNGSVRDVVLGRSLDAWIEKGQGVALLKLSSRKDLDPFVQDVEDGIVKNISNSYKVRKYVDITKPGDEIRTLKAIDWEPFEITFCPVQADIEGETRSDSELTDCEIIFEGGLMGKRSEEATEVKTTATEAETKEVAQAESKPAESEIKEEKPAEVAQVEDKALTENQRCLEITDTCAKHGLPTEFSRSLIEGKKPIEQVRKLIIDKLAEEQTNMSIKNSNIVLGADERDKKRSAAELSILSRVGQKVELDGEARSYRNMTLVELAKELDPSLRSLSKKEVAQRSIHTTSDFPQIFGNVANKSLRKGYESQVRTFLPFSREVSIPDYKEVTRIALGEAPDLELVKEGGEYKLGTIGEGAEKYSLAKYGKKIRLTEEMFVNDDLDALSRLPQLFGSSASRLENKLVYAILTGSHLMNDGKELFVSDHENIGTAAAISEDAINLGFVALANQKGIGGKDFLNLIPQFLICGPAKRMQALKLLASITSSKSGDVNIFQNALTPIIDPNISGNAWFLAASPNAIDTIEYGYLDGMSGPEVKTIVDEVNDAVVIKCKHVFAAKAIDFRGLYKNAGA